MKELNSHWFLLSGGACRILAQPKIRLVLIVIECKLLE